MYDSFVSNLVTVPDHRASGTTLAVTGVLADVALAVGLGVLRWSNSQVGQRQAEGALPTLALVSVLMAPGVLALIGVVVARPVLFMVAGIACFPLAIVSIAAVPIWLPAVAFLIAFAQASRSEPPAPWLGALIVASFTALLLVAVLILITGNGQYTYTYSGGSQGGDYLLPSRAALSILLVGLDLVVGTAMARQSRRAPAY
jgi:hypothetical protein